jgi:hypothetical protein
MRDEGDYRLGKRRQAMIHGVQMEALQVGDVAGNVERQYLTLAATHDLIAEGPSLNDQAALRRLVAIVHDILP